MRRIPLEPRPACLILGLSLCLGMVLGLGLGLQWGSRCRCLPSLLK